MRDASKNCDFCKRTFALKDAVTELVRGSHEPFSGILYGFRAYIDHELDAHLMAHEMEPEALKERHALNEKTVEVVGRVVTGFMRDCNTHPGYEHGVFNVPALDGAARGCAECLDALVREARKMPVFSKEDAAAVNEIVK
jgi:hypothetical protein